jgi:hypothetical protein
VRADHRHDRHLDWLANKTVETVRSWIGQPGGSLMVAVDTDTVLAVGSVADDGRIGLNYVSPTHGSVASALPCSPPRSGARPNAAAGAAR